MMKQRSYRIILLMVVGSVCLLAGCKKTKLVEPQEVVEKISAEEVEGQETEEQDAEEEFA